MTSPESHPAGVGVTAAKGFRAAGITAGIKASGTPDLALVINDGPSHAAAGVFTSNRVKAAPVLWSEQVLRDGKVAAVVLNSGGANACTGPLGFQDTHATAEFTAEALGLNAADVAVASTGLIGVRLPMDRLLPGVAAAAAELAADGGESAAIAIKTTDTVHKTATAHGAGWTVGGMAKGAGMLAPGLATMLVVLTTDADVDAAGLDAALRAATRTTFDRVDSDGCMSTNDTVLLLASAASHVAPEPAEFAEAVRAVCADLARQLVGDAEGASKDIRIDVVGATPRTRPSTWPAPSPATTCSSAPSTARTRTGAGCSPRSAPPAPSSRPTRSTSPSTGSGSARPAASARTATWSA